MSTMKLPMTALQKLHSNKLRHYRGASPIRLYRDVQFASPPHTTTASNKPINSTSKSKMLTVLIARMCLQVAESALSEAQTSSSPMLPPTLTTMTHNAFPPANKTCRGQTATLCFSRTLQKLQAHQSRTSQDKTNLNKVNKQRHLPVWQACVFFWWRWTPQQPQSDWASHLCLNIYCVSWDELPCSPLRTTWFHQTIQRVQPACSLHAVMVGGAFCVKKEKVKESGQGHLSDRWVVFRDTGLKWKTANRSLRRVYL